MYCIYRTVTRSVTKKRRAIYYKKRMNYNDNETYLLRLQALHKIDFASFVTKRFPSYRLL